VLNNLLPISGTIAAVSTAAGIGAISVVRMSGEDSIDIAKKDFCSDC